MLQSGSVARYKRARWSFGGSVKCAGVSKAIIISAFTVSDRICSVLLSSSRTISYAGIHSGARVRSRARAMLQSGFAALYKCESRTFDVAVQCTGIHEGVITITLVAK